MYFDLLLTYGLIGRVNQTIFLETKRDFELVVVGTAEVDTDGGSCDRFLRLGQTELHHKSA